MSVIRRMLYSTTRLLSGFEDETLIITGSVLKELVCGFILGGLGHQYPGLIDLMSSELVQPLVTSCRHHIGAIFESVLGQCWISLEIAAVNKISAVLSQKWNIRGIHSRLVPAPVVC